MPDTEKAMELKPCPFCGDGARLRCALWPSEGDTDGITHANPTECPAEGFSIGTADDGVSVIAAWNRRALLSPVEGKGEVIPILAKLLLDVNARADWYAEHGTAKQFHAAENMAEIVRAAIVAFRFPALTASYAGAEKEVEKTALAFLNECYAILITTLPLNDWSRLKAFLDRAALSTASAPSSVSPPWQLTNVKTQADLDTIVAFERAARAGYESLTKRAASMRPGAPFRTWEDLPEDQREMQREAARAMLAALSPRAQEKGRDEVLEEVLVGLKALRKEVTAKITDDTDRWDHVSYGVAEAIEFVFRLKSPVQGEG
jgi:hypothetical protein